MIGSFSLSVRGILACKCQILYKRIPRCSHARQDLEPFLQVLGVPQGVLLVVALRRPPKQISFSHYPEFMTIG